MKAIFILLVLCVVPFQSHAFKWSKCKKVYKPWEMTDSKSKNFGAMIANYLAQMTSQATTQSSTSTSSYVSSTGDCAAFAKAEEERHFYVSQTLVELQAEAAKGQGEHVESLAALYGCSSESRQQFGQMLKSQHSQIFGGNPSEPVTQKITEKVMSTDSLKNSCNLEKI